MYNSLSNLFKLFLGTFGYICLSSKISIAQITPDNSTNTTVNNEGNNFTIDQGDRLGNNLFHSFQDFSLPDGGSATFNNPTDISNIFNRVTGGNISNINGLIRTSGNANLFLINPAGIIFGENARLDIGGSFYASSASSIIFEDGEFNTTDLDPPLLTVNAPIGLGIRDNPGEIINRSVVENSDGDIVGLQVATGNNLVLLGGELNFDNGNITAKEGNIALGGLSQSGTVELDSNGGLTFPEEIAKADVSFTDLANADVTGNGGNITLNAGNLNLVATGSRGSFLTAGIDEESSSPEAQGGNITIDVSDRIILNNGNIVNEVVSESTGNSGNITIATGNLEIINGGVVFASTAGTGNAGNIDITATDTIRVAGESQEGNISSIISAVSAEAEGNAGNISLNTDNLIFNGGGSIFANAQGTGNAASVEIVATDSVSFDGESSGGIPTGVVNVVLPGAEGNSGDLTITTGNLTFTNGARIDSSTEGFGNAGDINITARDTITFDGENSFGVVSSAFAEVRNGAEGSAGDINITTNNLNFLNGGRLFARSSGIGDAGNVTINATDTIVFDGASLESVGGFSLTSGIVSGVDQEATGNGGDVDLVASNISFFNGATVDASTGGVGNAGTVNLIASDTITFDGESLRATPSGVSSLVENGAEGNAGNISLTANNINFTNGGNVNASTEGTGNAGLIEINANDTVAFDGETSAGSISSAITEVGTDAEGNGGGVSITASRINFTNGGSVFANARGRGDGGNVEVTATDSITFDGESLNGIPTGIVNVVLPGGEGNSGDITITTGNLTFTNGGRIDSSTEGIGNAGDININAGGRIVFAGENSQGVVSSAFADVENGAEGDAGDINITTTNLSFIDGGRLFARARGEGNAGNVTITATDTILFDGASLESVGGFSLPSGIINAVDSEASGNAGDINLNARNITFTNGGQIDASTDGVGNAGRIEINASDRLTIDGESLEGVTSSAVSGVGTNATGNAGGITITTGELNLTNGGNVLASAEGQGNAGNIEITTNSLNLNEGEIVAETNFGEGGEITLSIAENLILRNNSQITAQAFEDADGGNITINSNFIIAFPNPSSGSGSDIIANANRGNGGNIDIAAESLFGINQRPLSPNSNDINASSRVNGLDGTVTINTPDLNRVQTETDLPENPIENLQTQVQACENNIPTAQSSFSLKGKGGIPNEPGQTLNSLNILIDGKTATSIIPQPVTTSRGKIQPARGIKVAQDGSIILTAYPTNNAGDIISPRISQTKIDCDRL